jgi:hypothetical protein
MSLIDRYIAEVGRNLPEKDRSDIEAEIRSMVDDMIEERGHQRANHIDEQIITETLEDLGDPRLFAYRYAPPKSYLIGPGWYDIYLKTLKRVLFIVLPIFAAVTIILTLAGNPLDFMNAVGKAVAGAFNVGVQIWFWMTLVFVLMERSDAIPRESLTAGAGKWTVAQLPELPRKRQISIGESLMNIAFILFVMIWIALPAILARMQAENGPVPFLNPDLWNFWLPLLFVILSLTLVHEIFKLKTGNWTRPLMVTNVILCLISILYIAALVMTQDVINPAFLATIENNMTLSELQNTVTWAAWSVNITAAILICIYIWDIVHSIRMAGQFEQSTNVPVSM